jgi:predicted NUDIX family NTP pyrophosphohydrolase
VLSSATALRSSPTSVISLAELTPCSLVFQLVEFARNLTVLLAAHLAAGGQDIETSFPKSQDAEMTEDEWARRRRAFDEEEEVAVGVDGALVGLGLDSVELGGVGVSEVAVEEEARRLDREMVERRIRRV